MSIIPWIQNPAEILWWAEQTEINNADYKKESEKAKANLPKQKDELNKSLYWTNKSPEELDKFQQIINKVDELRLLPENSEKHSDELFEIAEILVEKELNETWEIPETVKPIISETSSKVTDILGEPEIKNDKWWIQWTKEKIQKRLWVENNDFEKQLSNKEGNISQASKIFFKEDQIWDYFQNPKAESSNSESLKTLWENLFEWDKIIDEDLNNILWNFVIETWKENLDTYSSDNPEVVNEALNNAFELQIEKVKDWKVNYKTETVENLKKEILNDDLSNPLEKLEKFKILKSEVNRSVWAISGKREKDTSWVEKIELKKNLDKLKEEYNKIKDNTDHVSKTRIEQIKKEAVKIKKELKKIDEPKSWEVIWGDELDKISWLKQN